MLRNYLKIVLKTLLHKKFFSALNLFGISTTVMIIMVAALVFDNHTAPRVPEVYLDKMLFVERVKTTHGDDWITLNGVGIKLIDEYLKKIEPRPLMCASTSEVFELYASGKLQRKKMIHTEPSFWSIYRFTFQEGRPFNVSEFTQHEPVVVISRMLRDHFFGNNVALGQTITIRAKEYRVIGVVDDVPANCSHTYADAWIPYSAGAFDFQDSGDLDGGFSLDILPVKGQSSESIKMAMAESIRRLNTELRSSGKMVIISGPENSMELFARGYADHTSFGGLTDYLVKWIGALLLFMLLPSINLMSLNITRIRERASEMAVRKAFGASRKRLFGQLLAENVILTMVGGVIGLILSIVVIHVFSYQLLGVEADQGNVVLGIQVNYYVFGFALITCLVFGLLSGVLPALRMSKLNPAEVLKGGSK
ncbi:MAG TPA: hypothetical protein DCR43_02650 [Bacteroidales bacterium]|nr:MAG: hypothetical protein A2X11_07240 [Bacteroidetes bacterium GWE2_42_24]OFY29539.1 MAG: hypothetical protein A2X09_04360 [Bacteroidetes bacterium GWF2_43_11]HAQ64743.1 hypothetical protein [Bacteroidales bacterium]HBZ67341.1 hypothetical protein [Bacteroidales bacterium]